MSTPLVFPCKIKGGVVPFPIAPVLATRCAALHAGVQCPHKTETSIVVMGPISPTDSRTGTMTIDVCACQECAQAAVDTLKQILDVGRDHHAAGGPCHPMR